MNNCGKPKPLYLPRRNDITNYLTDVKTIKINNESSPHYTTIQVSPQNSTIQVLLPNLRCHRIIVLCHRINIGSTITSQTIKTTTIMIYTVFVEHSSSIRSFAKIATTSYEKALAAYTDMVDYFSDYCSKGTNFSVRDWEMIGCTTFVACKIVRCDEHEHIIHFDKFEDD